MDDAMFYGRGAGEMPTASAVVGDVIDEARNIEYGCSGRISCTCYQQLAVKDFGDVKNKFFLRMQVENCPGVLAQIAKVFGEHKVSIARVVQKNAKTDRAELVIVTEKVKEKHMGSALCELKEMKSIFEVSSMIRGVPDRNCRRILDAGREQLNFQKVRIRSADGKSEFADRFYHKTGQ